MQADPEENLNDKIQRKLKEAEEKRLAGSPDEGYAILKELLPEVNKDDKTSMVAIYCRLANLCMDMTYGDDVEGNKKLVDESIKYCEEAQKLDGKNAEVKKWYGICVGEYFASLPDDLPIKKRISDASKAGEALTALKESRRENPSDYRTYNAIGRFHFGVAKLMEDTWNSAIGEYYPTKLFLKYHGLYSSYDAAKEQYELCSAECKKAHDGLDFAANLADLGELYDALKNQTEAKKFYLEALSATFETNTTAAVDARKRANKWLEQH